MVLNCNHFIILYFAYRGNYHQILSRCGHPYCNHLIIARFSISSILSSAVELQNFLKQWRQSGAIISVKYLNEYTISHSNDFKLQTILLDEAENFWDNPSTCRIVR